MPRHGKYPDEMRDPGRFTVVDADELEELLAPVEPAHLAELCRREEPCVSPRHRRGVAGFTGSGRPLPAPSLWSLWTFGEAAPDRRRLASMMLSQESPVCVRITVGPTELTVSIGLAVQP
jgi:hypothetical protein